MTTTTDVAIWSLVLQVVVALITVVWTVSRVTRGMEIRIDKRQQIHEKEMREWIDKYLRETGEMGLALRTKINEVEFYVRDNYVTNVTLEKFISMFEGNIDLQFQVLNKSVAELKERFDRGEKP